MPDRRRTHCKGCDRHHSEVGAISWTGLCVICAKDHVHENVEGMISKTGEPWRKWRRGMILCVGGVLPDHLDVRS